MTCLLHRRAFCTASGGVGDESEATRKVLQSVARQAHAAEVRHSPLCLNDPLCGQPCSITGCAKLSLIFLITLNAIDLMTLLHSGRCCSLLPGPAAVSARGRLSPPGFGVLQRQREGSAQGDGRHAAQAESEALTYASTWLVGWVEMTPNLRGKGGECACRFLLNDSTEISHLTIRVDIPHLSIGVNIWMKNLYRVRFQVDALTALYLDVCRGR